MKTQAFMVSLVILVCSGLIQQMIQQAMSLARRWHPDLMPARQGCTARMGERRPSSL